MRRRLVRAGLIAALCLAGVGRFGQEAAAQTCTTPGGIAGIVFIDADGDAARDAGETGVSGVGITITGPTGSVITTTTIGAGGIPGFYTSGMLFESGTYSVAVDLATIPPGYDLVTPSPALVTLNCVAGSLDKNPNVNFALRARPCVSTIGDRVWEDTNANGIQDAGEPSLANVVVRLLQNGVLVDQDTTDANGIYGFTVPCDQTFTVEVVTPTGYAPTLSDQGSDENVDSEPSGVSVSIGANENRTDIDFGFTKLCQGTIGNFVWHDANRNGIQDAGEHGIPNVDVELVYIDGSGVEQTRTDTTDATGLYLFDGLCAGTYTVRVVAGTLPAGYTATLSEAPGSTAANDSNAPSVVVTLPTFNSENLDADFGYVSPCTGRLGDFVWEDLNANGIQDAGEPGIGGVRVVLYAASAPDISLASSITLANGYYEFDGLCQGSYVVEVDPTTLPAGFTWFTSPEDVNGNANDTEDSDGGPDHRAQATLTADDSEDLTIDFGYYRTTPLGVSKTASGTYDRSITWTLTKSVNPTSHSGQAGQVAGTSTWSVTATKSVADGNYAVTGTITVSNANGFAVAFGVSDVLDDGTVASVACPALTVPANGSVTCSYSASPSNGSATLNTATITSLTDGVGGGSATAAVAFVANVTGDDTVTLGDARFTYSASISASSAPTFPETFTCPADTGQYVNGAYTFNVVNIATLVGASTNLSAQATVNVTCRTDVWRGETATGAGYRYPNTSNWFMYSRYTTSTINLIAGQYYDAGDIRMWRTGSGSTARTWIQITLHSGWRWASIPEVLKINPYNRAPTRYYEPGEFLYKFTAPSYAKDPRTTVSFSGSTVTVSLPSHAPLFYGIHGDVERLVP